MSNSAPQNDESQNVARPDWGKAPEGTTHYYVGSESPWRNLSEQDWKHWHDGAWQGCPPDLARGLDLSSKGLIDRSGEYLIARP